MYYIVLYKYIIVGIYLNVQLKASVNTTISTFKLK